MASPAKNNWIKNQNSFPLLCYISVRLNQIWKVSLLYSICGHKCTRHAPGPRWLSVLLVTTHLWPWWTWWKNEPQLGVQSCRADVSVFESCVRHALEVQFQVESWTFLLPFLPDWSAAEQWEYVKYGNTSSPPYSSLSGTSQPTPVWLDAQPTPHHGNSCPSGHPCH